MQWQRRYATLRHDLVKHASSDIVGRVSGYVAAIQVATEIACPLLGLRFKSDAVGNWLGLHLNEQQHNQNMVFAALRVLADHYVSNTLLFAVVGESYSNEQRRDLQGAVKRGEYVGFMRSTI
jgi:hypothetical protein